MNDKIQSEMERYETMIHNEQDIAKRLDLKDVYLSYLKGVLADLQGLTVTT